MKTKLKRFRVKIRYANGRTETRTLRGVGTNDIKDWFRRVSGKTKIKGLKKPIFYPKSSKIVSIRERARRRTKRKPQQIWF